jgi:hypothetical protein
MIEARCLDCGYRFKIGEEAEGLTAECPHCACEVVVPSQLKVELPLNQTIPPPVREHTVVAMPVVQPRPAEAAPPPQQGAPAVPAQPAAGGEGIVEGEPPPPDSMPEAQEDQALWRALNIHTRLADAISQPTRSFAVEAMRSGSVVLGGVNNHVLGRVLIADFILLIDIFFIVFTLSAGGNVGIFSQLFFGVIVPLVAFGPVAWHCNAGLQLCAAACGGQDEETAVHVFGEGVWDDLIKPLGRMLAVVAISLLPRWAYLIFVAFWDQPVSPALETASWALGLFLFPATVLLMVLGDTIKALSPGKILHVIVAAPGPYLAICSAMAVLCGVVYASLQLAREALAGSGAAFALGIYFALVLISMAYLVGMRVIGLLYRHFKAKLPFNAE